MYCILIFVLPIKFDLLFDILLASLYFTKSNIKLVDKINSLNTIFLMQLSMFNQLGYSPLLALLGNKKALPCRQMIFKVIYTDNKSMLEVSQMTHCHTPKLVTRQSLNQWLAQCFNILPQYLLYVNYFSTNLYNSFVSFLFLF